MSEHLLVLSSGWTKPNWAWKPFQNFAKYAGFETIILNYPHFGFSSIENSAYTAQKMLNSVHFDKFSRITFIGHSMGGLVGRYLIQCMNSDLFTEYVSLGTPHLGTVSAYLAPWSTSAREMRPNSSFLEFLNALPWPDRIPALNICGTLEEIVLPQKSALFSPAEDVIVPGVDHFSLILDPRVYWEIGTWLDRSLASPLTHPDAPRAA